MLSGRQELSSSKRVCVCAVWCRAVSFHCHHNHYSVQFLHRAVHRRLHLRSLGFYVSQIRGCQCIRLLSLCRAVCCFVFVFGLNVVDVLY